MWPFHVAWVSSQCGGWVLREDLGKKGGGERERKKWGGEIETG